MPAQSGMQDIMDGLYDGTIAAGEEAVEREGMSRRTTHVARQPEGVPDVHRKTTAVARIDDIDPRHAVDLAGISEHLDASFLDTEVFGLVVGTLFAFATNKMLPWMLQWRSGLPLLVFMCVFCAFWWFVLRYVVFYALVRAHDDTANHQWNVSLERNIRKITRVLFITTVTYTTIVLWLRWSAIGNTPFEAIAYAAVYVGIGAVLVYLVREAGRIHKIS